MSIFGVVGGVGSFWLALGTVPACDNKPDDGPPPAGPASFGGEEAAVVWIVLCMAPIAVLLAPFYPAFYNLLWHLGLGLWCASIGVQYGVAWYTMKIRLASTKREFKRI